VAGVCAASSASILATVAALTSLIEPLLIVFLGVVVGGIVMAMFLPIFQLGVVAGGLQ
jgi:type IV pilus assembly protein PilC